jgi:hypothetical protein
MMLRASATIALLLTTTLITSCSDKVADELLTYNNQQVVPLSTELESNNDKYNKVIEDVRAERISDSEMYRKIDDEILPEFNKISDKVRAIEPESEEIQQVHDIFVSAVTTRHDCYTEIMSGLNKEDLSVITHANEKLNESEQLFTKFRRELNKLKAKHNIVASTGE